VFKYKKARNGYVLILHESLILDKTVYACLAVSRFHYFCLCLARGQPAVIVFVWYCIPEHSPFSRLYKQWFSFRCCFSVCWP